MAQITVDIPAGQTNRVIDAIAGNNGYKASDGTKAQFAKAFIVRIIKDQVRAYEAQAAITANNASVDSGITIT